MYDVFVREFLKNFTSIRKY